MGKVAWIESHTGLERHPKLIDFRAKMRWSKNESIGFLHRFWWTVLEYAPSGDISTLSPEVMSESLDLDLVQVNRALKTLEDVNLLDRRGSLLLVHDWLDFAGRYLRDTKFRNNPEKLAEIKRIHSLSAGNQPIIGELSADSLPYPTKPDLTLPNTPPKPPEGDGDEKPKSRRSKPKLTDSQQASRMAFSDWWSKEAWPKAHNGAVCEFGSSDAGAALAILKTKTIDWNVEKAKPLCEIYLADSDVYGREGHPLRYLAQKFNHYASKLAEKGSSNGKFHPNRTRAGDGIKVRDLLQPSRSPGDCGSSTGGSGAAGENE